MSGMEPPLSVPRFEKLGDVVHGSVKPNKAPIASTESGVIIQPNKGEPSTSSNTSEVRRSNLSVLLDESRRQGMDSKAGKVARDMSLDRKIIDIQETNAGAFEERARLERQPVVFEPKVSSSLTSKPILRDSLLTRSTRRGSQPSQSTNLTAFDALDSSSRQIPAESLQQTRVSVSSRSIVSTTGAAVRR